MNFDKEEFMKILEEKVKSKKHEGKYFTAFQGYYHILKSFSDDEIKKVFGDDSKTFRMVLTGWKETIIECHKPVIQKYMATGCSEGEAMLWADKHFDDEIGYLNFFIASYKIFRKAREINVGKNR